MTPDARQKRLAYFAWGAVCLIWGTTYLGIRVSLESIPPALMGGLRWLLAGSLLTIYLVARGRPLPPVSQWRGIALLGFLMLGLGNGGVVYAEQFVPSGLAAVIVATAPFWMAAVESLLPDGERLRRSVIIGLVIGFSGIVLLVWPDLTLGSASSRGFLAGIAALQIAAIGWSIGSSYSKRHGRKVAGEFRRRFRQRGFGNGRLSDAGRGSDDDRRRHAPRRVEHALLHDADDRGAAVSGDDWRSWRVRGLHLRLTAPARVVRFAVRVHQPGDCRGARRPGVA